MSKYDIDLDLEERNSLSVIISRIKDNAKILEFGPANGRMSKYLKEQLNCEIYAVEIDEQAASDAKQYTEDIVVDSIENYQWVEKYENLTFDYIIFADVLEHLYNPRAVLEKSKKFLSKHGSILVSIPNIAHNSVIMELLKNEFNYRSTGILDDTHIRFFTKKTFDELINVCDLHKVYETAIFIPPENTEFFNSYSDLPFDCANYLKSTQFGEAYQFVYELKNSATEPLISEFCDNVKNYHKSYAQLFFDIGAGICEADSEKIFIDSNTQSSELIFEFSNQEKIRSIRFDPLNESCIVEIDKLVLVSGNSEIDLLPYLYANSAYVQEKKYFFDVGDPQIYIDGLKDELLVGASKIVVKLCYINRGDSVVRMCINEILFDKNEIQELLAEKENQLVERENQLAEKENQLAFQNDVIQKLKLELSRVLNSTSWRLTAPMRRLMNILKFNRV